MAAQQYIDWADHIPNAAVEQNLPDTLDCLPPTESGRAIHDWLGNEFQDEFDLRFEGFCEYQDSNGEWRNGRYDAFDGVCVYEFKTVHRWRIEQGAIPREDDVEQIEQYMQGLGAEYGSLVYIDREQFDVDQYVILD